MHWSIWIIKRKKPTWKTGNARSMYPKCPTQSTIFCLHVSQSRFFRHVPWNIWLQLYNLSKIEHAVSVQKSNKKELNCAENGIDVPHGPKIILHWTSELNVSSANLHWTSELNVSSTQAVGKKTKHMPLLETLNYDFRLWLKNIPSDNPMDRKEPEPIFLDSLRIGDCWKPGYAPLVA